jgi:lysophospholipase L1-like esterase
MPMPFLSRTRVLLVTTILIGIVGALTVAEVGLRLLRFEFVLYPTAVQFGWPDPVTLRRLYRVDRQLLWVPEDYASKVVAWQGKRPTVVFMGDSCTQFGAYDKQVASIAKQRHPSDDFTFVNGAVGGWSSFQGLAQLKRDVVPMKPRIITVYYGWNDHWVSFGIEDKEIGKFNLDQPTLLLALSRLRVVQLINQALFTMKYSTENDATKRPERVSLADFATNLRQIVQIARDNGITPILLTAPSSHQEGAEPAYLDGRWLKDRRQLIPIHQKYVGVVRAVASEEQVPLVDLYAEFGQLPRQELTTLFQQDGIHLTDRGDRKIAETLYAHLEMNKLLP